MKRAPLDPSGDAVIVSGASGDIGLATTLALASSGLRVWAGIRDPARRAVVLDAAQGRGLRVDVVDLDVCSTSSVNRAVEAVLASGARLYGVVNNAATTVRGYFEDLNDDEIRRVIEVNLYGTMNLTRRVLPELRAHGRGRIVNISSVGGRIGTMGLSAYVASKFALEGFSESLALEVRPLGIHVVLVEPGIVRTRIWESNRVIAPRATRATSPYSRWFQRSEELADRLVRSSKLRPEDVARVIDDALRVRRPRMRYVVGRRAALVLSLRRHLPGEWFERLYFGELLRRVTREDRK